MTRKKSRMRTNNLFLRALWAVYHGHPNPFRYQEPLSQYEINV